MQPLTIPSFLAGCRDGLSPSAAYLEAIFPAQVILPIKHVAQVCSMSEQAMRHHVMRGTFPIDSFLQGHRRFCRKADVADYLERLGRPKGKRGAKTKAERIAAREAAEAGGAR